MNTIGFVISHKEHEHRRALIPEHIPCIRNKQQIFVETGYGDILGYSDQNYLDAGVHICSRDEALRCDIVCDPKIGDAEYLNQLHDQIIFGWIHAVQNRDITDKIIDGRLTAYAWEDMYEDGRHVFWRNNEIAGEAAVSHAYLCHGIFPYNTKVAILGRGNTARGAQKTLNYMGAEVVVYDRHTEALFRKELPLYDVVVNAILWDTKRKDHIIYREDLKRMKKGAMIIDISCDKAGAVETSVPTTIESPTYMVEGIRHYVVDHTPSLFYKTTSRFLSEMVAPLCDELIKEQIGTVLQKAKCIENGKIIDTRINDFQKR